MGCLSSKRGEAQSHGECAEKVPRADGALPLVVHATEAQPDVAPIIGGGRRPPLVASALDDDQIAVFETVLDQHLLVVFHYAVATGIGSIEWHYFCSV